MEVIYLDQLDQIHTSTIPALSLAIGYFDGVHIGHQTVIKTAIQEANKRNIKSAVMTFDPSPKEVLSKNMEVKYLTLLPEKIKLIEQLGIDYLFIVSFTLDFASLPAEQFVSEYLVNLNVKHLVAGFDFTYGKYGKGNMNTIEEHGQGNFSITTVEKVANGEAKISSSAIRSQITSGNLTNIPTFMNRYYTMTGKVIHGEKRGRTIGFPTANLQINDRYVYPPNGVYAVRLNINNEWVNGVCNIGFKPTFHNDEEKRFIEVHLFDFHEEIYGECVILEWHKRIRDEKKFFSIDDLIKQINQDKQVAIQYFDTIT